MSDELALSAPASLRMERSEAALDLEATHQFRFVSQRWFAGVGAAIKGGLMILVGVFLFSQISATPNLVVQMAIIASLLCFGGAAFLALALGDFVGRLVLNDEGYQIHFGLRRYAGKWSEVNQWTVHDSVHSSELPGLEIRGENQQTALVIPGDYLPKHDWRRVYRIISAFAPAGTHHHY